MAKCLQSVHSVDGEAGPQMTNEEMQQSCKEVQVLHQEMKPAGDVSLHRRPPRTRHGHCMGALGETLTDLPRMTVASFFVAAPGGYGHQGG
jgi:hypothetical protein